MWIPIRGTSPEKVKEVYDAGVVPDLIYIDGDHRYSAVYSDLETCRLFFPTAILAGDDWNFSSDKPKYHGLEFPVRQAVIEFTEKYSLHVHTQRDSWIVTA